MRLLVFLTFLMIFSESGFSADSFELIERKVSDNGAEIIAVNRYQFPVSVSLSVELENLKPDRELPIQVMIPPNSAVKVISLSKIKRYNKWSYRYHYNFTFGDVLKSFHDDSAVYHLQYLPGKSYKVVQGYNGEFSHHNKNSLDFNLSEGDTIVAARAGVVLDVQEMFNEGCPKPECSKYGNYLRIMHEDGSIGEYFHLLQDGALVEPGEQVLQGQVIGLSGNTGYSKGPHLHFTVYLPTVIGERRTVRTKFMSRESEMAFLEEFKSYTAF